MSAPTDPAHARLADAVRAFERAASDAVAVAANPKASRTAVDDARLRATFALAAVGAALKAALRAARPADDDA